MGAVCPGWDFERGSKIEAALNVLKSILRGKAHWSG